MQAWILFASSKLLMGKCEYHDEILKFCIALSCKESSQFMTCNNYKRECTMYMQQIETTSYATKLQQTLKHNYAIQI